MVSKKLKDNQRESVKEGDTYGGEIEVQEHIDTETIPSKMKFGGEESVVVFDLETTGLSRKSDITQLAAFDGTTVFNQYVSPREVISPKSSEITGLTFDFSCDQMYHHGKPVKSRDIQIVLLEFIEFISKKKKPILFGHNIASFDIPILMNKLLQHSLLSEFMLHIYGCIDTIKLARRKFKTKDIGNHKQQTLVTKLLGVEYDAHNACADVTSLFQLLAHFEYSEKDVFPFNSALLTDSYIPLIRASRITKLTARRLAHSGLCLKHLQLAFNRDSENGLKSILLEHGFNAKTVTCFTKYFTCTEE
ncbi:protein PML-like [Mytilus trossulus]|uniref:protein PML-like n=1 Tax=Mytilus trossulus TaxID=6551 RepID=UPI003007547F